MLYLSQILNSRVEDSSDAKIGTVKDILIEARGGFYSPLVALVVRTKKNEEIYISYDYVANLSKDVVDLKVTFSKIILTSPQSNCVFLNRDVMDQQIVDVDGARVVRVNDLSLGVFENKMCVLGVDVSLRGIMRRLGLSWLDPFYLIKSRLIDWRKTQPVKGTLKLDTISKDLTKLHPADLANIVEDLNLHQGTKLVSSLEARDAAQVLEELNPHLQKILVHHLGPEKAAQIINKMSTDEIVDLLQLFSRHEAKKYLALLQDNKLAVVEKLIKYEDDTAGGLMNTEFISVSPDLTAQQTIEVIRKQSPNLRAILSVYVVNNEGKLLGPVSLRTLLLAKDEQLLSELHKDVSRLAVLHPHDSLEKIVNLMTKYDLYSAAVINSEGKIVGVVTIDDVMRCLVPKA